MRPVLAAALPRPQVDSLQALVESFDFAAALDRLSDLRATLSESTS
jgi:hypothetical protein